MNPAQLLSHFDRISDAPDAIPRLRRFILDLAVRGKLVERDPRDVPASELLKRIQTGKARLAHAGEIKKGNPLPTIEADEIPFSIPANWQWVRLNDITSYIQRGKSPKYAAGEGLPVISQKCVQWGGLELESAKLITCESIEEYEPIRFLRRGDLLWNSTGTGTIGRIIRVKEPPHKLVCDSHVTVVRCLEVDAEYVRSWLRSDHVYGVIEDRAAGSTNQVELTSQLAMNQVVPLPPLAEQHRIVAKVDELMALCDRLEAAQAERESRRDRLVASSLHRLNNDADAFRDHARFYFNRLPRLTTRSEHIQQLRQTILNFAVRGKLIPQDPDEEPASELLFRIGIQRTKLLAHGYPNESEAVTQLRKQQKQFIPEGLQQLPSGWQWATLMQCSALVVDCHNKTAPYSNNGIILLRTTNVRNGMLNLNEPKFVDEKTYARWSARCQPQPGDILITREAPMGEVCIIPEGMKVCLGQRMMLARLVPKTINPQFLLYSLRDPNLMDRVQGKPVGATVQHLRVGGVETLLVPLPPLAEQHRIVSKVKELMALCDRLETQLTTTQTESCRLLEAVLHEALAQAV